MTFTDEITKSSLPDGLKDDILKLQDPIFVISSLKKPTPVYYYAVSIFMREREVVNCWRHILNFVIGWESVAEAVMDLNMTYGTPKIGFWIKGNKSVPSYLYGNPYLESSIFCGCIDKIGEWI